MTSTETQVRVDTHAHLYPCFAVDDWLAAAVSNLMDTQEPTNVQLVVVVTDREEQDSLSRLDHSGFDCTAVGGELGRRVLYGEHSLLALRGVQYVASERIEVLGLGVGRTLPDRLRADELVRAILDCGGVPCLPWSPGKWLGSRGAVVRRLMDQFGPERLTLGDVAIRAPSLMWAPLLGEARRAGFRVLFGSDPLPFVQEVAKVGQFGVSFSAEEFPNDEALAKGILQVLGHHDRPILKWGVRDGSIRAVRRSLQALCCTRSRD